MCLVPFQGADEQQDERADMAPVQYMEQYVDIELMKVLADCTNSMSLAKSGRSLNTSVEDVPLFWNIHLDVLHPLPTNPHVLVH